jgi:hypothetical protein
VSIIVVQLMAGALWAAAHSVVVDAHTRIPLVVLNQSRERIALTQLEMAEALNEAMMRDTSLALELVPSELVNASLQAEPQPPVDVFSRLAEAAAVRAAGELDASLVVTYAPRSNGKVGFSAVYLRPKQAVAKVRALQREDPGWRAVADETVLARAVPSDCAYLLDSLIAPAEVDGSDGLLRALRSFVTLRMKPCLEAEGVWNVFSTVRLELPAPGFEIAVDGRVVGSNEGTGFEVEQVREGKRVLSAAHPSYGPWRWEGDLVGAKEYQVRVDAVDLRRAAADTSRRVTRWTAVGAVSIGAAALIAGGIAAGSRTGTACVQVEPGACSLDTYERVLGVPLLPLGLGLVAGGVVAGAGVYLDSEDRHPWLPILVSVISSAGLFATMWVLE